MRQTFQVFSGAIAAVALLSSSALAAPRDCSLVLHLDDAVPLGSLQMTVDYSSASGFFGLNLQDKVDCTNDVLTAAGLFNDNTSAETLTASFISIDGFSGPATVAHCLFVNDTGTLSTNDFAVTVTDAAAPDGSLLDPLPKVSARLPDCDPTNTSTTTTSTTVTTTEPPPLVCELTLQVTSTAKITSLDWRLGYQSAPGEFAGSGGKVSCTNLRPGSLASFNDVENQRTVRGGIISLNGFDTPADIARCRFLPTSDAPVAADFTMSVIQATDADGVLMEPLPKMKIDQIQCGTGICGDGLLQIGEDCDDGNLQSRDGCSASCTKDTICGDANLNGSLSASDALQILKNAVGADVSCPPYVCDTNASGKILASDALTVLKRAVGTPIDMVCPPEP